jgi:hypothetical protein
VLRGLELAVTNVVPVDVDPRVAGPLAALTVARATQQAEEAALPNIPDVNATFRGILTLTLGSQASPERWSRRPTGSS